MPLASIPNDAILQALSYLGASDISAIYITGRVAVEDIPGLCASVGGEVFQNLLKKQTTPKKKNKNELAAGRALQTLRVAELVKVLNGLNDAQESGTRGYWVSKSWAQQFRRYTEAQRLLLGTESASPNNGQRSRGRSRSSSSESLPPWPDANAELLCEHGSLGPRNGPRAKRLIVDRSTWRTIAYRFPLSTKLKVSSAAECRFCLQIKEERHIRQQEERSRLDHEKQKRLSELETQEEATHTKSTSSVLRRLASKERAKRGIPQHCLSADAAQERQALGLCGTPPLLVGRYHLVPRGWLQLWRSSLRSARHRRPGPPNTGDLLCMAHCKPLVPHELVTYLHGHAHRLTFPNPPNSSTCEVLDAQEWTALNNLYPVDFAVAFDVTWSSPHTLHISWATEPCTLCDAAGRADDLDLHFRSRSKAQKHSKYYDDLDLNSVNVL